MKKEIYFKQIPFAKLWMNSTKYSNKFIIGINRNCRFNCYGYQQYCIKGIQNWKEIWNKRLSIKSYILRVWSIKKSSSSIEWECKSELNMTSKKNPLLFIKNWRTHFVKELKLLSMLVLNLISSDVTRLGTMTS